MPEGDTVFRAARELRAALVGERLTRCDIRVPRFATVDLAGEVVDDVVSRGKHLLIRVGDASIHTHLKMEGIWHIYQPGEKWRRPAWQARIILGTARSAAVGFQLGVVEVLRRDAEDTAVGHLGPDLLGPDWDAVEALTRLRANPGRTIGEAVLDQRMLAGIGNVYRSELCFLVGVLPETPVGDVPDLPRLVTLAQKLLAANRERSRRSTTGRLRGDTLWVYGRDRRPCLRCGTAIRQAEFGDPARVVYWCPNCQR
ncbi:DNA-formamidopyrimidine glycosylase family protein [Homoserinimonas sp. OAct 916]|uniref:DNA-formamidopyrimidine glycosylase family protein n=1 Tax=Homoserinimonas sp. OAct 916 TaxID=2211450 RepID=UPI000DBE5F05|nr:DNA-formamidopyrimidine glycosylase family protein [Homoserinimonas sp. OAct 916]